MLLKWVTAVALLWDGNPLEKEEKAGSVDVNEEPFTEEEATPSMGSEVALTALAPLESGTLTSGYGERIHPIEGITEFHDGVDIAAPTGTALLAVYDGEVTEVGENERLSIKPPHL